LSRQICIRFIEWHICKQRTDIERTNYSIIFVRFHSRLQNWWYGLKYSNKVRLRVVILGRKGAYKTPGWCQQYTATTFSQRAQTVIRTLRPCQTKTHCCGHIVADTNVSPFARTRNIYCGHKLCVRDSINVSEFVQKHLMSATNVSQFAQPKKHHEQQCVRNNVSSFARAFTHMRRRRRGHLVKMCFHFTLEFRIYLNYPVCLSVLKLGLATEICHECVQFQTEIRKINR